MEQLLVIPYPFNNVEQMQMVVRNLLDNAIKYTPSGGKVTLRAWVDHGKVKIAVADNGIGIPPEAMPYIFERFYRVDKARSRQRSGAGLGLALVRSIVEAHGGQVEVKSQPGVGSVFTLSLPAKGS